MVAERHTRMPLATTLSETRGRATSLGVNRQEEQNPHPILIPWKIKTAEEWKKQEETLQTGISQASWFVFVAAQHDQAPNIHNRQFLEKWGLQGAYDAFFLENSPTLEAKIQQYRDAEQKVQEYLAKEPAKAQRQKKVREEIKELCSDPEFLSFLIMRRDIRNTRKLNPKQKSTHSVTDEAMLQLDLEKDARRQRELFDRFVKICADYFYVNNKYRARRNSDETVEDAVQEKYTKIVYALTLFPYWETAAIAPNLTINKLLRYVSRSLWTEDQNRSDASRLQVDIYKPNEGTEISLDAFQIASPDPEDIVLAQERYKQLRDTMMRVVRNRHIHPQRMEMFEEIVEGEDPKVIAEKYGMKERALFQGLTTFKKAVAAAIDPLRVVENFSTSDVWRKLLDPKSLTIIKADLEKIYMLDFQRVALQAAIEKAEELIGQNQPPVNLKEAKDILVAYAAKRLQEKFPNVSKDPKIARHTSRRAITFAWEMLSGRKECSTKHRGAGALREKENKEWRDFVHSHPGWESYFTEVEVKMIHLYRLQEVRLSQVDVAKVIGLDPSRINRRLATIEKKRKLME